MASQDSDIGVDTDTAIVGAVDANVARDPASEGVPHDARQARFNELGVEVRADWHAYMISTGQDLGYIRAPTTENMKAVCKVHRPTSSCSLWLSCTTRLAEVGNTYKLQSQSLEFRV